MAALWMSGIEDDPALECCGEICVVEVFGNAVTARPEPSAEVGVGVGVGVGIKPFRDPALEPDFAAPRLPIDVREPPTYAVDWTAAGGAVFTVDGVDVGRCARVPDHPLQLMLAVFDFPEWSTGDDHHLVPELVVDRTGGSQP